ncbi:hypothetical protein FOVG_17927 [Fusarium oxysporum f. sp. pisi HDV247]|uniref:C2H2-type domain-containing protein n=1 Tax=Fusarium oxysporum f. sp. pisi HDV247 TaxID=1080344 RepID=W9NIZ0_FUSOX|nr:hypothetical protein FOVG_17927 [Fusarium oxysporum f. sp. pisi HDV247]
MSSSEGYCSSEDDISGNESCEGQLRESAFYTNEKIEDAVKHISSQAFQQFAEAAGSAVPPDEFDHFKYPFNASNPGNYRDCLANHDLRSIESVIMHMQCHHKRPSYCSRCSKTFETVAKCNAHKLKRKCKPEPLEIPDGINHYQASQLENKTTSNDYTDLRSEQRWEYIYKLVFRESQSYPSATMDTEDEKRVLQARVFWKTHGWELVNEYFHIGSGLEIEVKHEVGRTFRVSEPATMFFRRNMTILVQSLSHAM